MVAHDLLKYHVLRMALGAVANILLNLWFIPLWGAAGSALATVRSFYICIFSLLVIKPAREVF
jgi:Na+-driven multidrug efflux pump